MGDAIGAMLPTAVGVTISPLPIVAVVLMLVTPEGRTNGLTFLGGWFAALVVIGALVLVLAGGESASDKGQPATWVSLLQLALGLALLLLAAKEFRSSHAGSQEIPSWMQALDSFSAAKAAGLGALLAGANPKNLLLVVAGAASIGQTGIATAQQAGALLIFALIGSIGVGLPVGLTVVMGERSREVLDGLKSWLQRNNDVIMGVLLLVIGVKELGEAISGL